MPTEENMVKAEYHYKQLLAAFGIDFLSDEYEDMVKTPARYVKALSEMLSYEDFEATTFDARGSTDMVVQTPIGFSSLCRHHTLPFFGSAAVAYIPDGRIIGLSKLARFVQRHSAKFQTQEYLCREIAQDLKDAVGTDNVAVYMTGEHSCMSMRGACVAGATTKTSHLSGVFKKDPAARAELLAHIGQTLS